MELVQQCDVTGGSPPSTGTKYVLPLKSTPAAIELLMNIEGGIMSQTCGISSYKYHVDN